MLAMLEGLQVAVLRMDGKDPEHYVDSAPRAYSLMKRALHEKNVRRFLIGRQFFVIFVVFLINQCTIFPDISRLGIPEGIWFAFVSLGFPTALNILCWCQLPTQILANQDPLLFMNRPGARFVLEVCLYTEMTGLSHFSWVVASISRATWFQIDSAVSEIAKFKAVGKDDCHHPPTTDAALTSLDGERTDKGTEV